MQISVQQHALMLRHLDVAVKEIFGELPVAYVIVLADRDGDVHMCHANAKYPFELVKHALTTFEHQTPMKIDGDGTDG